MLSSRVLFTVVHFSGITRIEFGALHATAVACMLLLDSSTTQNSYFTMELGEKTSRLILLAKKFAEATPDFLVNKGPGVGDRATNDFMGRLRRNAKEMFGVDYSEAKICGNNSFSIDYYFEDERTAVEFAFSLEKPMNEFERDIFKCLLAEERGHPVRKLVLVGKPRALARLSAPGPKCIRDWVALKHALEIEIVELSPD